ncbi:hypothetical protein VNI00_013559 [Paramarasmius palmivorus]|uniref:G-protein coupled receptors family 2 profile 2 domain-containing protein n=1 Tax=Paramarasmius palmivorus TaxID=297713 RepID=A0AAW0BV14_9AGAR
MSIVRGNYTTSDGGFIFTQDLANLANKAWYIPALIGSAFCFVILSTIAVLAAHPLSRAHLDRVSFRIMAYALVANFVYGIVTAVAGIYAKGGPSCSAQVWVIMFNLHLSSFLLFCIGLNLLLVIRLGISGCKMEKYYVGVCILVALCVTIPPYATRQYGWDEFLDECWYDRTRGHGRLPWQVSTQMVWNMLTVLGELSTFTWLLIHMIRNQVFTTSTLFRLAPVSNNTQLGSGSRIHPLASMTNSSLSENCSHLNGALGPAHYRNIILRIALYPIASFITLSLSACGDIYLSVNGISSRVDYNVLLLSNISYGLRPVLYALVAAVDPSLHRAIRVMYHGNNLSEVEFDSLPSLQTHSQTDINPKSLKKAITRSSHRDPEAFCDSSSAGRRLQLQEPRRGDAFTREI